MACPYCGVTDRRDKIMLLKQDDGRIYCRNCGDWFDPKEAR